MAVNGEIAVSYYPFLSVDALRIWVVLHFEESFSGAQTTVEVFS